MYSFDDPVGFISSFYGCLIAGVVPLPIDPPVKKDVNISLLPYSIYDAMSCTSIP